MAKNTIKRFEVEVGEKFNIDLDRENGSTCSMDPSQIELLGYTIVDFAGKPVETKAKTFIKKPFDFTAVTEVNLEYFSKFIQFAKKYGTSALIYSSIEKPIAVVVPVNQRKPYSTDLDGTTKEEMQNIYYFLAPRVEAERDYLDMLPPNCMLNGKMPVDKQRKREQEERLKKLQDEIEALKKEMAKESETPKTPKTTSD